jgi:hypothetical protein
MNEIIKELLKQSTASRWYCGQEHAEVDQEKFAELIVRKCAEIAETAEPYQSSDLIKHKFGIQE